MDDIPDGELHGVETDRIGRHHRSHGFSPMNYFYFEKSSEDIFGNPGEFMVNVLLKVQTTNLKNNGNSI